MDNILNERVRQLIKEILLDYAKVFGVFLAISLLSILILIFLPTSTTEITIGIISFGAFIIVMFIAGIVSGAELPAHIRTGIARNEYFKANLISAIIISVILMPISFILDFVLRDFRNVLYNSISDNLLGFTMHILLLILFYLIGYFIAMIFLHFGWFIGVIVIVSTLAITGIVSWSSGLIIMLPSALNETNSIVSLIAPEILGPTLITLAVLLASVVYYLVKVK